MSWLLPPRSPLAPEGLSRSALGSPDTLETAKAEGLSPLLLSPPSRRGGLRSAPATNPYLQLGMPWLLPPRSPLAPEELSRSASVWPGTLETAKAEGLSAFHLCFPLPSPEEMV